jgi:GAF domain-containing protein
MELLQLQSDEGPCLEAYRTATQVRIPELSQVAGRWPRFVAAVARGGAFASVHAIPLRLRGQAIGALNLFHREPGAMRDADLALGQALADVATIGILQERAIRRGEVLNEQLQTALHSRMVIEQAKGVVAQHLGVGMDGAFDRLRRYARTNNQRLAEVAHRLVGRELDLDVLTAAPARSTRRTS